MVVEQINLEALYFAFAVLCGFASAFLLLLFAIVCYVRKLVDKKWIITYPMSFQYTIPAGTKFDPSGREGLARAEDDGVHAVAKEDEDGD